MRNYLCKWPNGDIVLISARDKQQVREILDEQADPGNCEIVRMKGAFAMEFKARVPAPPRRAGALHDPGLGRGEEFRPPEDATIRPRVARWAGNTGFTVFADLYQEYGGPLSAAEAAAVQRWRDATQQQQQRQQRRGRGEAAAAAVEDDPWITEEQIQATGMVDNPYCVPVEVRDTEYGKYSDHIKKQITKHFFPRTHDALKVIAESRHGFNAPDGYNEDEAVWDLRAALSSDIADKQKEEELDRKQAKLMADANNGNKEAQLQIMTDQTANVYGPEDDDDEDEFDDDDEDDDDSSDEGIDFINAIRHGRAMEIAAALGVQR